jgi:putative transposase
MKNGRFSDAQIMGILKQAEGGVPFVKTGVAHAMLPAKLRHGRSGLRLLQDADYLTVCVT